MRVKAVSFVPTVTTTTTTAGITPQVTGAPFIPFGLFPRLRLGEDKAGVVTRKVKKPTKYTPTLGAVFGGYYVREIPKQYTYTGFEKFRPLVAKKIKRKRLGLY